MTTVSEIETAIAKLTPAEYRELLAWIESHHAMVAASDALFTMYDDEEAAHVDRVSR
jgi:L-amino acid N-acyltransferase YncA